MMRLIKQASVFRDLRIHGTQIYEKKTRLTIYINESEIFNYIELFSPLHSCLRDVVR